jgi:hypothetical protein
MDVVEQIQPHEWIDLEWEPNDDNECRLQSKYSKRRMWTRVRFLKRDLLRNWPRSAMRRGPKPVKREEAVRAMRREISEGRMTRAQLEKMPGRYWQASLASVAPPLRPPARIS